ncbi:ABC transporter permease subunit [Streptomyces beijiangensis]|uniref:ABC transporter permease subunit n=1 Tax=Streptomyces beijiangensis TaxID=163361 RepID=A0A939F399_9ACTN|nr:ABC transporter permease subunit [Streptomyces beijiangensis]MBO0510614.1 ABC transporter permease subunit [Streptomyces beijiangensis]
MIRALRAEWTKLRSVRSTAFALFALVAVTLLLTVVTAKGSVTSYDGPLTRDQFTFAHTPVTGNTTLTTRVASLTSKSGWAKAGLMIKDGTTGGSPSASLMLTPGHGVRMQVNAKTELTADTPSGQPRWLRLTRTGQSVTGYESADGLSWHKVGTLAVPGLPARTEAGLFVTSPAISVAKQVSPGSVTAHLQLTTGRAVFDHTTPAPATAWTRTDTTSPPAAHPLPNDEKRPAGTLQQTASTVTLTGNGDLGYIGIGGVGDDLDEADQVKETQSAIQLSLITVVALGVLFMTSEYKTRTIRTTFTASPKRGRVLAAKAAILGATVFAVALPTTIAAFLIARPIMTKNGYKPPIFPTTSLTDPTTLRAVVGGAAFLAVLAVFCLGVGAMFRRTVPAIVTIFALLIVVPIISQITSVSVNTWVERATPIAGRALTQTKTLTETSIGPWAGFAVLCLYAAAALGAAHWRLTRRDA